MKEKAEQLLEEMKRQEAHFSEQLAMTRGGIQTLEHLLAFFSKDDNDESWESSETD